MAEIPRMMDELRGRYEGLGFKFGTLGLMLLVPVTFAALALGMAEGCLDCFTEQARRRKPFNLPYPAVADMPSVQVTAGKARAAINVARATIYGYADELDRRALRGEDFAPPDEPVVTMDLIFAITMLAQAIDSLQVALGSSTASLQNPIQRFVRDVRVLATHGALRLDPMAEINGREILGMEPFMKMAGFEAPAGR
jgi:alkylation response protein AidB-like acyl-CoA dehydrogenase